MTRGVWRRAALAAACLALAGCAATSTRSRPEIAHAQDLRSSRLAELPRWTVNGRIAVSDGRDGGSGRIEWAQDAGSFDIAVRAPVAGGSWRLTGTPRTAQLDGVREQPQVGRDPAQLLARELGWQLPLDEVRAWIRGLPLVPARARIESDAAGLPRLISEAGWQVEYRAWMDAGDELPMPRRLIARKTPYEVRIAIDRWSLHGSE